MHELELNLNKLNEIYSNLILKSISSEKPKIEYSGLWVACDGVKPIDKNILAIKI